MSDAPTPIPSALELVTQVQSRPVWDGASISAPSTEMEFGGQALERWPRELFVSAERATQALNHFLQFGKQDPALEWIRLDAFPRETVWDNRAGREAWERANPRKG